jgi:hypothetical protein
MIYPSEFKRWSLSSTWIRISSCMKNTLLMLTTCLLTNARTSLGIRAVLFIFVLVVSGCAHKNKLYVMPQKIGLVEYVTSYECSGKPSDAQLAEINAFMPECPARLIIRHHPQRNARSFVDEIAFLEKHVTHVKKIACAVDAKLTENEVVLDVIRYVVALPPGPDWSMPEENQALPNMGYAQAHNLGVMLADPYELKDAGKMGPTRIDEQKKTKKENLDGAVFKETS